MINGLERSAESIHTLQLIHTEGVQWSVDMSTQDQIGRAERKTALRTTAVFNGGSTGDRTHRMWGDIA